MRNPDKRLPIMLGAALLAWLIASFGGAQTATPTVKLTFPTEGSMVRAGDLEVRMSVEGATLKPADDTHDPKIGHFHLYLDKVPEAGKPIPKGVEGIWHTPNISFVIKNVSPGVHTLILVWAYGDHVPFSPWVTDTVMFEAK